LLTDWVTDADQFFVPDEEMVFYESVDDLQSKIEHFLTHEEERQSIIDAGKQRVLNEHTYAARVPGVIDSLNQRITEQMG
jgi:spore maturation protein CgeB